MTIGDDLPMPNEPLSRDDLRRALRFIARVQQADDLDSYRREVAAGSLELIGGNVASYNEIHDSGETVTFGEPEFSPGEIEIFSRFRHQNPLIGYHQRNDDVSPVALSDLISAEDFHATDVYRRFYARFPVEDQIAMRLPGPPGVLIAVVVNRPTRGFSDRDRGLLELVRPHALQSFRMAQEVERSREQIAVLERRLAEGGAAPDLAAFADRYELSARQREVVEMLAAGASTAVIAQRLGISRGTVLKHVENLRSALGVHTRVELLARLLGGPEEE